MVTYEWFKDGSATPVMNGGNISGADTPTLMFTPITFADTGTYVLEFTDESKATFTSPPISVLVVAELPVAGLVGRGCWRAHLRRRARWRCAGGGMRCRSNGRNCQGCGSPSFFREGILCLAAVVRL